MRRLRNRLTVVARDERGMTLVELLVATAAGVVVVGGISVAMIVTVRGVERVSSHVEANRAARLTLAKVVDQLHSACLAYGSAPIREDSTGTLLSFTHQSGSTAALTPVLSKISLSGTTLKQADYEKTSTSGSSPTEWAFKTTPYRETTLQTGISQASASIPVFRYYGYSEGTGAISSAPFSFTTKLGSANAAKTVQVSVAFKATPGSTVSGDANAATPVQSSAYLRMGPPSFATSSSNQPCQ